MTDKVPQKVNWPTILIVVALLAGFYFYIQPEAEAQVKQSAYESASVTPEIKMAQIQEGVQNPKQNTVDKFHDLITAFYRIYKVITRDEIADQLILFYKKKQQNYASLFDFTMKFKRFVGKGRREGSSAIPEGDMFVDLGEFVNP